MVGGGSWALGWEGADEDAGGGASAGASVKVIEGSGDSVGAGSSGLDPGLSAADGSAAVPESAFAVTDPPNPLQNGE